MNRRTLIITGMLAALSSAQATADYTVQIGAMGETHAGFADRAAAIGSVTTRPGSGGLTVYQVGRYGSPQSAEAARDELQGLGYGDAFIRRLSDADGGHAHGGDGMDHAHREGRQVDDLSHVPPELRDRVVYLDGRLHVMEGDRFIPLDEYQP